MPDHTYALEDVSYTYAIKEVFYTLQGEGARAGRAAVLLRFAGCNLWSGREADRAGAVCRFCDTDFVGMDGALGGRYRTPAALADAVARAWADGVGRDDGPEASRRIPYVVCTGGEPFLQLDAPLVDALRARGFEVGVETNGTLPIPRGPVPAALDWICVSPKANAELRLTEGDELKLVYPQVGGEPSRYASLSFRHFFLQPMDGPDVERHTAQAAQYCLRHPQWRLSLQLHKLVGLP